MSKFQQLMKTALVCGALAGGVLFVYQYFVMVPRIVAAEAYEVEPEGHGAESHDHEAAEWKPAEGLERDLLTAASTVLTGIGFAAIFLPAVVLSGVRLTLWRGLLWGLAGFACFVVAPGLGLPPEPPGVPVADLTARQLWWGGTAVVTAIGLFLIFKTGAGKFSRLLGVICLLAPHAIGAPQATGTNAVPEHLLREFAIASVLGNGLFWLILGASAGRFLHSHEDAQQQDNDLGPARAYRARG